VTRRRVEFRACVRLALLVCAHHSTDDDDDDDMSPAVGTNPTLMFRPRPSGFHHQLPMTGDVALTELNPSSPANVPHANVASVH
jgi:hypothetical protein